MFTDGHAAGSLRLLREQAAAFECELVSSSAAAGAFDGSTDARSWLIMGVSIVMGVPQNGWLIMENPSING